MQVREIMTRPAASCRPDDTLNAAAKLMWENDCGAVPVAGDDGTLIGIITDRDICMATYTRGDSPGAIPVRDAMAKTVFSCRENEALEDVAHLMRDKQIRRVPIVDEKDRPIGIVSQADLVREAVTAGKKSGIERALVDALSAISRPRGKPAAKKRTNGEQRVRP